MSKQNTSYITTTLPYVNGNPHMGHALEFVQADALVRTKRLLGEDVFFNIGTDEHGQKIYEKAKEEGVDTQAYVDGMADVFRDFAKRLNLDEHNFIRTTDEHHMKAAQEFWMRCKENGDIYKKDYETKYCVGCELEKTDSELEDGVCTLHPHMEIEIRNEENYFFKFSKYQEPLLALYTDQQDFIVPEMRLHEIQAFVERGLTDFSISRLKEKMPWGVPVPDDADHVMYVWFDALVNYISAIGWPDDTEKFQTWWPVIQLAGKDNLRPQTAMWQAMLLSAGLPPSKKIAIHGFITSDGKKMSKSLGNVVDPIEVMDEYGTDALRYYLLREVPSFEDGDFTTERFKETYNANLANGLGNLVSRVMKMATTYGVDVREKLPTEEEVLAHEEIGAKGLLAHTERFTTKVAMDGIWAGIGEADAFVQKTEPFKTIKTDEAKAKIDVAWLVEKLWYTAVALTPFLPETSQKIKDAIQNHEMPESLFMRK